MTDNSHAEENAPKRETNVEFLTRIMEHCPTGALAQVFVLDAIDKLSKTVVNDPPIDHPLIDGEEWKRTAIFIQDELAKR